MKINTKIIVYFLGFLLLINGGFMFLTALLSYIYQDGITNSLLMSGVLVTLVGLAMLLLNKNHDKQINKREGYLVVVLGWLAMIFSGTIPYILTGTIDGFSNIFFETTSGFTATGATIINDVEILPEGILFWRSITHWLGGMGMIVFAIAILPYLELEVCSYLVRNHLDLALINYILESQIQLRDYGLFMYPIH
jgi:trk system potassium uptake protein TrkH